MLINRIARALTVFMFRVTYKQFLKNPARQKSMKAQILLRKAFLASRGQILNWAHNKHKEQFPYKNKSEYPTQFFSSLGDEAICEAVYLLKERGWWTSPVRLPEDWIEAVSKQLLDKHVTGRRNPNDIQVANALSPNESTYWYESKDLEDIPEIRALINDQFIREIIARYLETQPVYDFSAAWWSYPNDSGPDSAAAQLYHYDLDRIRWLKVFVYLTDVRQENGPHCFIEGSHNSIGSKLSQDRRFQDYEVFEFYSNDCEKSFVGPRGTVFIEDTLGFHKGKSVVSESRLVFEFQCSISHFGYPNCKPAYEF